LLLKRTHPSVIASAANGFHGQVGVIENEFRSAASLQSESPKVPSSEDPLRPEVLSASSLVIAEDALDCHTLSPKINHRHYTSRHRSSRQPSSSAARPASTWALDLGQRKSIIVLDIKREFAGVGDLVSRRPHARNPKILVLNTTPSAARTLPSRLMQDLAEQLQ
jgi:hypothetical protein